MRILENIVEKQRELTELLNSVEMDELRQNYSRKELVEFQKSLRGIKSSNLSVNLLMVIEEKKREEFPQLNSVHHFPVLNGIDFLTLSEKEKLDEYLVRLPRHSLIFSLYEVVRHAQKLNLLDNWLRENGVMEAVYMARCPHCMHDFISGMLTEEEMRELVKDFNTFKNAPDAGQGEQETVEAHLRTDCSLCGELVDVPDMDGLEFDRNLRMVMERDRSLDTI